MSFITAITPRIIMRNERFTNFDFSEGGLVDPPTGWAKAGASVAVAADHATIRFLRGSDFTIRTVRFDAAGSVNLVQYGQNDSIELNKLYGAQIAVWPVGPSQPAIDFWLGAADNAGVVKEFTNATMTSGFTIGAWNFMEASITPIDPLSKKLYLLIGNQGVVGEDWHLAYPHCGRMFDFGKKFNNYEYRDTANISLGLANFAQRSLKEANSYHDIKFGYEDINVVRGSALDTEVLNFWRNARSKQTFSFWRNASKWSNSEDHFTKCVLTSDFEIKLGTGPTRYDADFAVKTPEESRIQDIVRQ